MTIEEMEAKVKALEDKLTRLQDVEEIRQMHTDYIFLLTQGRYEEMIDYFAENASVRIRDPKIYRGREEINKLFKEVLPERGAPYPKGGQILVHPVIKVDGDRAKGYWGMFRLLHASQSDGTAIEWYQGKYECEYVREKGKWKFSVMDYTIPWPVG